MEVEQLKQIVCIANVGTLSAAAEHLHLSQSALSRSVRRLEGELGLALFNRTKNSMTLSDAGQRLMPYLKATLADAVALAEEAQRLSQPCDVLRIGSCSLAPLWKLVPAVSERVPKLQVRPDLVPLDDLVALFSSEAYDIAILPYQPEDVSLRSTPLMTEHLHATVQRDHALASRSEISFDELDGMTFLIYAGSGYWKNVCSHHMPASHYVVQDDYVLFSDISKTSPLPGFVTNVSQQQRDIGTRVAVPISDTAATITFYMVYKERSTKSAYRDLLAWLERRLTVGSLHIQD